MMIDVQWTTLQHNTWYKIANRQWVHS